MIGKIQKFGKRNIIILLISLVVITVITVLLIKYGQPLFALFASENNFKNFVRSAGVFGPIVFVLLQILQIIIAPIPGQATGLVGGYLFGLWGFGLSMVGAAAGYYLVFLISRRFGRPLAEKLFSKKQLDKFDILTEKRGAFILFLVFILPTFPDDLICYLAGLTKISIKKLMLVAILGRAPGFLLLTLLGVGLGREDTWLIVIAVTIVIVVTGLIFYLKRDWLHKFVRGKSKE